MSRPTTADDDTIENAEFTFVMDQSPHQVRSHAMREHWKQRRKTIQYSRPSQQWTQPILPKTDASPQDSIAATVDSTPPVEELIVQGDPIPPLPPPHPDNHHHHHHQTLLDSIPAQALSGMNLALGNSRLDPFERFPIKLTALHHKLLHHWLSIYATMMFDFENLPLARFNPMRDVWFPLDLSNAASFNAVMAQSAAHLARMQGFKRSAEALKFKAEAIRILSLWMADEKLALGDDVVAAVSRILAYERYWGTEAEWQVHRAGLQRMIDARGGIASLQGNWRLELTVYLILLMVKPSWFDSSNQLWEICNSSTSTSAQLHPVLGQQDSLHRLRSLWVISFIQDMRTLMVNSIEIYSNGLVKYVAIQKALEVIRAELPEEGISRNDSETCNKQEYAQLACLLFINVAIQSSIGGSTIDGNDSGSGSCINSTLTIGSLETFLLRHSAVWFDSTESLYNLLFYGSPWNADDHGSTAYVLNLVTVISYMSLETRRGVERCLLHILQRVPSKEESYSERDWTPDTLLSSIHGI